MAQLLKSLLAIFLSLVPTAVRSAVGSNQGVLYEGIDTSLAATGDSKEGI